ncbi:MAG: tryptophan 2,3-dioxygenase family protein [Fulvivirga sp.]
MKKSEIDPKIIEQIKKLDAKFEVMGQDISSYLDGLLYADYLTYWDYVHLDTLLSLQNPKTQFEDELIFITYHQHTELFFKLVLHEIDQLTNKEDLDEAFFIAKLDRLIRYFEILTYSFEVMVDGMERDQFLKFRMSLLPASGFQSAQYRLIEISSTDLYNLVDIKERSKFSPDGSVSDLLDNIYWKNGATELSSGKKTLTLKQFEDKYMSKFFETATDLKDDNLLKLYQKHFSDGPSDALVEKLKQYDALANISWPLAHYKSAVRYLQKDPEDIAATGGTNWQKFLPPKFQKIIFFPELWSEKEKEEWGKTWVVREVFGQS